MEKCGLLYPGEASRSRLLSEKLIETDYLVDEKIFARGKFAAVKRAFHKHNNAVYAAKYIRKRRRTSPEEVWHEVSVLDLSRECPFIVHLFQVFETPLDTILILEMLEGGDLQSALDADEYLDEVVCIDVLKDTTRGLSFLHQHSIAHLDIKPQNLVVTGPLPGGRVKLCDFGVSRFLSGSIEVRELLGTPDYVSPEVLNYEPLTLATDCWAVGVLTYVLLSGVSPFGGDCKQETFLNISQRALTFPQTYFESVSSLAIDFIEKLLVLNPSERLTADGCLRHNWLDGSSLVTARPPEPNNNHKEHNGDRDRFSPDKDPEIDRPNHTSEHVNKRPSQGDQRGPRTNDEHDASTNNNRKNDHSSGVCLTSETCHADFTADAIPTRMIETHCN